MGTFLPARLKRAREDAGLTQEAFARSLGVSSEFISLLESGKRSPSLDTLSRIAGYFNKDAANFLGEREPGFTVLYRGAFRGLDLKSCREIERFQRYCEAYLGLEEATGRRLELAPLYSGRLSPERMASEERRRLGLGDEPVRDIFALLERNGLRILRQTLPPAARISGILIFLEAKNAAFAMVNSAQTSCRQAFTAAHEYCHYLKDRQEAHLIGTPEIFGERTRLRAGPKAVRSVSPLDRKEKFAQEFAAHFLMPPAKVRELVERDAGARRLSYEDVLLIKRYFGVSAQAMLRTLRNLGLLTPAQYNEYWLINPVSRERQIFGATDEVYGPGSGLDTGEIVVSERYRLLENQMKESGVCHPRNTK